MDKKRMKRSKAGGNDEEGMWDCSVCTYKNSTEAFKCAMCDVRKGTSTRKPKPNPQQLVAQQVAQQQQIAAASAAATAAKRERLHSATSSKRHSAAVSNTGDSTAGETDTSMDSTDAAAALHRNSRSLTPPTSAGHTSRSHLHPISTSTPAATHQKNKTDVSKKAQKTATTPHTAPHNSSGAVKRTASIAGLSLEVTVGDVTVIITDYKPKRAKEYLSSDSHTQSQDSLNQSQHEDCLVGGVKQENANGSLVNHTSSGSVPDDSICDPAHGDSSSNTASSPSNTVNNISSSSVASSDCDTAPVEGKLAD